jgi:hypothetical protein
MPMVSSGLRARTAFHELVLAPPFGELAHLVEQVAGVLTGQVGDVGVAAVATLTVAVGAKPGHAASGFHGVFQGLRSCLHFFQSCRVVHFYRGLGAHGLGGCKPSQQAQTSRERDRPSDLSPVPHQICPF